MMMTALAPATTEPTEVLSHWARAQFGNSAIVSNVTDLAGHSGQTFGFTLVQDGVEESLVARFAPTSLGQAGADALLRQANLLRRLGAAGVNVPGVRHARKDAPALLVMERLEGQALIMGPEGGPAWTDPQVRQDSSELAAGELARLHSQEVFEALAHWTASTTPRDEIERWVPTFARAAEPEWSRRGEELREVLLRSMPDRWTARICHGDFQTNNILFTVPPAPLAVSGIIDWELAHIGSAELDLAWFLMMNDGEAWHPMERRGGLDHSAILASYREAGGNMFENLHWFQALACYRMAAITGYQIRLHRTGRKIDSAWERASSSMPSFFDRAHQLTGEQER